MMVTIDRRALLLGTAGLLVSGCGSSTGGTKTSDGPNIVKPRTGTVVTAADAAVLKKRLNKAFEARDVEQLVAIIDPADFALDEVRARWTRRFDNFSRLDFVSGEWYVGVPGGRTRNASGGQVESEGDLVFTHRIKGCDARPVVETYSADFRKKSTDSPLELMHIGEPEERFDPSFWDVATIDAIETEHAYVAFRTRDAALAKKYAAQFERGAKRALTMLPRPKGVSKIFYAITWSEISGTLWGGISTKDTLANAYYHPFLDPEQLATGQEVAPASKDLPKATGRVGIHPASFSSSTPFFQITCHEAAHVIADQWLESYADTPTWVIEGFARWTEYDKGQLVGRYAGELRANFAHFASIAPKGYEAFHDGSRQWQNYQCAAAVFAYLDEVHGRESVFELVEAFYGAPTREKAATKFGRSEKDLVAATRAWLGA